jgi:hypothetical protein
VVFLLFITTEKITRQNYEKIFVIMEMEKTQQGNKKFAKEEKR